jgi:hypothetical protein
MICGVEAKQHKKKFALFQETIRITSLLNSAEAGS